MASNYTNYYDMMLMIHIVYYIYILWYIKELETNYKLGTKLQRLLLLIYSLNYSLLSLPFAMFFLFYSFSHRI